MDLQMRAQVTRKSEAPVLPFVLTSRFRSWNSPSAQVYTTPLPRGPLACDSCAPLYSSRVTIQHGAGESLTPTRCASKLVQCHELSCPGLWHYRSIVRPFLNC